MTRNPDSDPVMRVNDDVPIVHSRQRATVLIGVGLLMAQLATALLFVGLGRTAHHAQTTANLSASDVQAIRQLIAERGSERDAEHDQVQAQLDEQARVLCLAIDDFLSRSSGPGEVTLDRAHRDLGCDHLPPLPSPSP